MTPTFLRRSAGQMLLGIALLVLPACTVAQDLDDLMSTPVTAPPSALDDLMQDLSKDADQTDFLLLTNSLMADLRFWLGVESDSYSAWDKNWRRQRGLPLTDTNAGWRFVKSQGIIEPVAGREMPVSANVCVPVAGRYRIWLRHQSDRVATRAFLLKVGGAGGLEHRFNDFTLTLDAAKKQETLLPIRFEDEAIRATFPRSACWVWEYWDTDLKAGETLFELMPREGPLHFTHIFITQSKRFTPRLGQEHASNLTKVYYRFRVRGTNHAAFRVTQARFLYHARYQPEGAYFEVYSGAMGARAFKDSGPHTTFSSVRGDPDFRPDEWSDWLDVTWAAVAAGSWATARIGFDAVTNGLCDVQLAWQPHPGAVVKTITPSIEDNLATFCVALDNDGCGKPVQANTDSPGGIWGFFGKKYLEGFKTTDAFVQAYRRYAAEARDRLGLAGRQWKVEGIVIAAKTEGSPSDQRVLVPMLVDMGFNRIVDQSPEVCRGLGIEAALSAGGGAPHCCDPADPARGVIVEQGLDSTLRNFLKQHPGQADLVRTLCVGDEIGLIAGAYKVNQSPECMRRFRDYLRQVLAEEGQGEEAFFGVSSLDDLACMESLPAGAGLYERRLYSHTRKFLEVLTADYYRPITLAVRERFPNALTYANYSPAPLRQGSHSMNSASWFNLLRRGALSLAWGEDWVYRVGAYTGYEIVGYYAALTECAARELGLKAGFYSVPYCGFAATNLFAMLSRSLRILFVFDFGPLYFSHGWEGPWSDQPEAYVELTRALYAISLIDRHVAQGQPQPRRTAVLYNRDQEIMNQGVHGEQGERALTFAALTSCHRSPDVILNEDLTPDHLRKYGVLVVDGFCLPRRAVPALEAWVREGNLLILGAHAATRDEFNSSLPAMDVLRGARSLMMTPPPGAFSPIHMDGMKPVGTVTVHESEFTPSLEPGEVFAVRTALFPTTAVGVATFEDGSCAATVNTVGRGHVLSWGFDPGLFYKGDAKGLSHYRRERLAIFDKPLRRVLGEPPLSTPAPQVELNRFDLGDETGILVNNYLRYDWTSNMPPTTIRIKMDRPVQAITSAFHGKLEGRQENGWLTIAYPMPECVDTLLLK